jgi:integrase
MSKASHFKFTPQRLSALALPQIGETSVFDTATPGLAVRLRATGAATYSVRYRLKGLPGVLRMTLGPLDALSLPDAREQASAALMAARQGIDPRQQRKAAPVADLPPPLSLSGLIDLHEAEQVAHGIVSAGEAARMLRRELAPMLARPAASIRRPEIVAALDKVRDGVPGHAAPRPGSVATLRARVHGVLSFGQNAGLIDVNVMAGYKARRRSKATRVADAEKGATSPALDMREIAGLWRACGDARVNRFFAAHVRLLILTGCRRGEAAKARRSWLSLATPDRPALMTIPASETKAGRAHVVPLPPLAMGIIAAVPERRGVDLLTPGSVSRLTGKHAAISGWSKTWPALLKVAKDYGLARHVRIHDLRKTFRSHLGRLGVSDRVAGLMLNHAPPDKLIGIYDKHDYLPERVAAMAMWCGEIETAVAGHEAAPAPADIVPLRRKRAA